MKTKGFDIEAVRVAEDGPFEKLTTATLIAAVQVLQMVRERDGVRRAAVTGRRSTPTDQPALEATCAKASKARPRNRRTLIPKGRWHMPAGSARALAGGQGTMASRAHRNDARVTISQGNAARLETQRRCVNLVGLDRAIQYSRDGSERTEKPRRTGSPGAGYANRLRPKADFGGQEATPRLRRGGAPKL